ncbi:MAG: phosphate ABC transporter substrate-binding protein [Bacillota bacterium]|nr:phosphate ABC transporter substrate-binding protein [Bacillota bacterium]
MKMKSKWFKTIIMATAAVTCMGMLASCGSTSDSSDNTISLAGSTSMEKVCEALSESFMNENPDYKVTVEYTGSGAGLEALEAGSIDIGNSSRALSDEEKEKGAVENIVALDGIAVITDKDNTVSDLSSKQLADIYTGKITNWKDLGGKDESIVVLGRESGSGTRDAFEELMEVADKCEYAQEIDSTGGVLATVASTPGAIGYVSLDVVDNTVNSVKLNGVEATEKNILSGDYQLQRPFVMATIGKVEKQKNAVQKWFEFVNSDEGQKIIKEQGLIIPEK